MGTELGLWISVDGGTTWAEFKGGDFPAVAVREVQVHPRENDLVIATHGRGIWIVDDITPLRALDDRRSSAARPRSCRAGRCSSACRAAAGGSQGDAAFVGPNPPGGAVDHVLPEDAPPLRPAASSRSSTPSGKVVETIPATKRRGLNRVVVVDAGAAAARAPRGVARLQRLAGAARRARRRTRSG